MKPPAYLDIDPADIPVIAIEGGQVKLIAGRYATQDGTITGPLKDAGVDLYYLDVTLRAGATFSQPLPADYGSFVYPFEGEAHIGSGESSRRVPNHSAGVLSDGDQVKIHAGAASVRFLLLAGRALHEPVAQYGPFVMNTAAEIEQALRDYQNGTLALPA